MKILVVKIGALGDMVMASSMIAAAQARFPGAKLTWLCGSSNQALVKAMPGVDEILTLDDAALLTGRRHQKAGALLGAWRTLAGRSFDLILTGHADPRYHWITRFCRAGERRGFGRQKDGRLWPLPGRAHAAEYARLVTGEDGPAAKLPTFPEPSVALSPGQLAALPPAGRRVALAPGGARNLLRDDPLRRWPLESYVALAKLLKQQGCEILLTGGPADRGVLPAFQGVPCHDWIAKTTLPELVALYGSCDLVVTHDSGPMHLAAWSGTRVLALFGPTNPAEKTAGYARLRAVWGGEDLACRPCYDGRNYAACPDNRCLTSVPPQRVAESAKTWLGEA